MENMENGFAQYCLKRLELLEKENIELKAKLKFFEENSQLNRSNFLYYEVKAYDWYIDEKSYTQYEKAITNWDANWLNDHSCRINSALADYEISIGDKTYYFKVEINPEGNMNFLQLNLDNEEFFDSYLAAKEHLIKIISTKIAKVKAKLVDKAKEQAE